MPNKRHDTDSDSDGEEPWRPLLDQFERIINNRVVKTAMGIGKERADTSPAPPKRVLTSLVVEEDDTDATFLMLLTQPGFEAWHAQLEQLQKSIELWQQQGLQHQQICSNLHVAIFSEDEEVAIHFTKHYHAFLRACRVLPLDDKLHRIDGTSTCIAETITQMQNGMYLVSEAGKISSSCAKDLSTVMKYGNTVVVSNYIDMKKNELSDVFEGLFRFQFDLTEVTLEESIRTILRLIAAWSEKHYGGKMKFEEGLDGQYAETFARRIAGKKGNTKAMKINLQEELGRVVARQTARLLNERAKGLTVDKFWISKGDLLGQEPDITAFQTKPWQELQAMVGLEEVKKSLESFLYGLLVDFHRELQGQRPLRSGLSKLFIGPPGTGKTTVAKLYGEILGAFGLLTSGELVVKNASDFIGRYIGHSEKRTRDIISNARGKVLLIDEAYMLDPFQSRSEERADPFRQGVIDTIVGEIQNLPGEDICVIMCGYKDLVELMIQRANPGLARRFPMADAFIFKEFNEAQLEGVLDYNMHKEGFKMTDEAKKLALESLNNAKQRPNFGNGGEVTNLIGRALANYRTRFGRMSLEERTGDTCFEPEDIDPHYKLVLSLEDQVEHIFDHYVGVNHLKDQFKALARRANALRRAGRDPIPFMPFHLVFKGPLGTGKTSAARKMGWLYKSMKLLATDEVVDVTVRDMIADSYSRESSKVVQTMRRALGKVLFVDEAHRMTGSGNDQIDILLQDVRESLIDATNYPEFQGKTLVILAGSEKVDILLKTHTRYANLFRTRMQFYTLSTEQCLQLLEQRLCEEGAIVTLTEEQRNDVKDIFSILRRSSEWANGRDINMVTNEFIGQAYENGACEGYSPIVTFADILRGLKARIPQRLRRPDISPSQPSSSDQARANEAVLETVNKSPATAVDPSPTIVVHPAATEDRQTVGLHDEASHDANQDVSVQQATTSELTKDVPQTFDLPIPVSSSTYSYTRLPKGRYTRVVLLQPARDHRSPLQVKLGVFALEDDARFQRRFDALSYVWGSADKAELIFCDGSTMLITPNCAAAMRHLRNQQSPRALWIDAICIDQDSVNERSHQVLLMGEIYEAASHVFIWLGTASPEVSHAIANIRRLCALRSDWGEHELIRLIMFRKFKGNMGNVIGMEHIMRHNWWRRMWTFQEFVLAERPVLVIGNNKIQWEDLVDTANNTFFSTDSRDEMVRRKRQNAKADELVINNIMPPDEAEDIRGREISIHLIPLWKDIMNAHKGRVTYQLGLQNAHLIASDFLLEARTRQSKDPKDKLYGLYYILQACDYQLPSIDYSEAIEKIYEDITFSIVYQSKSWWILSHLFRARETSTLELPSWVPEYCSQILWHQRMELFKGKSQMIASRAIEWPQNHFYLERLADGAICTSGIFLWTVTSSSSILSPTRALDKSFEVFFEEARYEILLTASEDFLFTMANWLSLMTNPEYGDLASNESLALGIQDTTPHILRAISRTFISAASARGHLLGIPLSFVMQNKSTVVEHQVYKIISAIKPCMSPSPSHPCPTCGTTSPHEGDDAMQHFIQMTSNQATWLNFTVYILYSCALNRSLFRTSALDGCPGHFGFSGGQPRPGDEIVLLPGASGPVVVRRRPGPIGADYYRIIGVTSGIAENFMPAKGHEDDDGNFCSGSCEVLDDVGSASRHKPQSFCLL
ncbi:Nn.00g027860.m01.CDS01 [Neocucurbitaria sp. VM-36]